MDVADKLFQNARVEYMDVLFAQRDRNDARIVLIDTKREQLSAIVYTYQALGGGWRYNQAGQLQMPAPQGGIEGPPVQMPFDQQPAVPAPEEVPAPPSMLMGPTPLPDPATGR